MMYYPDRLFLRHNATARINPKNAATNSTNFFRVIREIRGKFFWRQVLPQILLRLASYKQLTFVVERRPGFNYSHDSLACESPAGGHT
jgi:hypothetical protein